MNFRVIPIGGCSCAFQDSCVKILDFSTKPFDRGDEIKARSFPKLTFLDVLGVLEVKMHNLRKIPYEDL